MNSQDSQTRSQILSRWAGATVVVNYLHRTGDMESCPPNPYFPLARAVLMDVIIGSRLIPTEKREEIV